MAEPGWVLGAGPAGWWDSERSSAPQVLKGPDGRWWMWYYGRDATFDRDVNFPAGRSGVAVSDDGIHWERVRGPLTMGAVLDPNPRPGQFDSGHVGVTDVHYWDGLYWMFYLGGDGVWVERMGRQYKGLRMRPGCAISRDGLNWTRVPGPYQGALIDTGPEGAFDNGIANWPRVLRDDTEFKLYYHSRGPQGGVAGLAVSPDGLRWEKVGPILYPGKAGEVDAGGIGCRHVIKHDGQYLMFYEAPGPDGYYNINLATSPDGYSWTKDAANPIFEHAPKGSGAWDSRAVGTPRVVPLDDGTFRLYYVGVAEGGHDELSSRHQIGMAVSEGTNYRTWRRVNSD